jgi:hypothetical protein
MSWDDLVDTYKYIGRTLESDWSSLSILEDIIVKFIVKKELILYGGISLDYALKLKGKTIYSNHDVSDYDVYSSNHIRDSEEIVNQLSRLGYQNISAIRAIHIQTMRIRWNNKFILDISYIPKIVLDRIPILKYNGMPFTDPIYQFMDMHISLSLPYSGVPYENITHRWKKDINRYNMIIEEYPIHTYLTKKVQYKNNRFASAKQYNFKTGEKIKLVSNKKLITKKNKLVSNNKLITETNRLISNNIILKSTYIMLDIDLTILPAFIVNNKKDSKLAISGFATYAIIRKTLDKIANMLNISLKLTIPKLDISFSKGVLHVEVPNVGDNKVNFITYEYMEIINKLKDLKKINRYRKYLDINFEYIEYDNVVISSSENSLLAALFIDLKLIDIDTKHTNSKIYVASIQYLLLYFLFQFHITNYTIYLEYYMHTLDMINAAEKIFLNLLSNAEKIENVDVETLKNTIIDIFNNTIFAPVISTFGTSNISVSYIFMEVGRILELNDIKNIPDILGLKNINFSTVRDLPINVYPNKKNQDLHFLKNTIFNRDGGKINKVEKINLFD